MSKPLSEVTRDDRFHHMRKADGVVITAQARMWPTWDANGNAIPVIMPDTTHCYLLVVHLPGPESDVTRKQTTAINKHAPDGSVYDSATTYPDMTHDQPWGEYRNGVVSQIRSQAELNNIIEQRQAVADSTFSGKVYTPGQVAVATSATNKKIDDPAHVTPEDQQALDANEQVAQASRQNAVRATELKESVDAAYAAGTEEQLELDLDTGWTENPDQVNASQS